MPGESGEGESEEFEPTSEFLLEALRQNWEHARFAETQRLTFASVYGAVVAGVLFFAGDRTANETIPLYLLLFGLSIAGLLMTMKWNIVFDVHLQAVDRIMDRDDVGLKESYLLPTTFPPKKLGGSRFVRLFRIGYVFDFFYILFGAFWFYLGEGWWMASLPLSGKVTGFLEAAISVVLAGFLTWLILRHESESGKIMEKMMGGAKEERKDAAGVG